MAEELSAVSPRRAILAEARFHPKLKLYWYLQGILICIASIVGIAVLPFWLAIGPWWCRRYHATLACILGERSLVVRRGIQFRTEKTIPLDKLQDVSVRHGPLLNWLGLSKLALETAGQGSPDGAAASLTGVIDAIAFRDRVLEQRDRIVENRAGGTSARPASSVGADPAAGSADAETLELLRQIRDSLGRIEQTVRVRAGGS